MREPDWSPKQDRVEQAIGRSPETETVVVVGPVQSGKTFSTVWAFLLWSLDYTGEDFLLATRSRKQAQGTLVRYCEQFADTYRLQWRRREDHYILGANRFFILLGGKKGTEAQARSFSAMGALADEATILDDEFINSLADRCSRPGAKFIMVCNPAGPAHPIKTDWVDSADGHSLVHIGFELADNPTLTPAYVASLHRRYSGPMKARMVYGEWAVASGAVFPHIADAIRPLPRDLPVWRYSCGLDYAHSSVTHAVLRAHLSDGTSWVVDEWRHDGDESGRMTDEQQADAIMVWLADRNVDKMCIDPNASAMFATMRRRMPGRVLLGDNDVSPGIQMIRRDTEEGTLLINRKCVHLVREMLNYEWDALTADRGDDKPVKRNDHGIDGLRYDVYSLAGPRRAVRIVRSGKYAQDYGLR